jgi:choline dehydrogenase-like flavoprotein
MPRGKMLGGSSGINGMMYVRGSEADYDSWAHLVDDEGWNSKSMLQYMKKHEVSNMLKRSEYAIT